MNHLVSLDPISREKLQEDLIHLQKAIKKTIVFVTHDMNEAMKLADRTLPHGSWKNHSVGNTTRVDPAS